MDDSITEDLDGAYKHCIDKGLCHGCSLTFANAAIEGDPKAKITFCKDCTTIIESLEGL
jgi:predicted Zn-dependent protease